MKKLSPKWLLLEHYRLAIETEIEGVKINVWKPCTMGLLPTYWLSLSLEKYARDFQSDLLMDESRSSWWSTKNPDYGCWDAQLALRCDRRRMTVDVYVCALLCRPFSREAREFYDERCALPALDRLKLMWDSRNYDEENGFNRVYSIADLKSARRIYFGNSVEDNILESCPDHESRGLVPLTCYIDSDLYRSLVEYAFSHGITISELFRNTMKDFPFKE